MKDTPKEAKLHGLAVSFSLRLSESSFLHFTLTLPKRGFGYFSSPSPSFAQALRRVNHAGNLAFRILIEKSVRLFFQCSNSRRVNRAGGGCEASTVAPIVTALGKATLGGKKLKEQSNERRKAGAQAIKPRPVQK